MMNNREKMVLDIVKALVSMKDETYQEAKRKMLPEKESPVCEKFYKCLFEYTDKHRLAAGN